MSLLHPVIQSLETGYLISYDFPFVTAAYDTNGKPSTTPRGVIRYAKSHPSIHTAELTSILAADLVYDFLNVLAGGVDGREVAGRVSAHEEL